MTNDLSEPPAKPFCKKTYIPAAAAQAMTMSWYRAFDLREYMMRSLGVLYPESMYSPRSGRISLGMVSGYFQSMELSGPRYHVRANVNQYVNRHATSLTPSGSHIPLNASSSGLELEARSMGTRSMMLIGRARDRKMGKMR